MPFPNMLPIWLTTDAITPVARPSAKRREYDNTSLSHPVMLYTSYAPNAILSAGFLFSRPDINTSPTTPMIASAFASILRNGGNVIFAWAIDAKISVGISIKSRPIKNAYHKTTSQKKSRGLPSFRSIYPLIPSPTNKWTTPNAREYTKSLIGSFKGTNQSAGTVTVFPKNVPDTISTTFPKYPPNRIPHTSVEIPQNMNILRDLCMPSPILGNFFNTIKHAIAMIAPYAASDNIIPKKNT